MAADREHETSEAFYAAWAAVHAGLPAGWRATGVSYDPGRSVWTATAIGPKPTGRGNPPPAIVGQGSDRVAALRDLATRLRG